MNVSTNCEKCQLYKSCVNPFLSPVIDWRAETKDTNICLVVADYTDGKDDEHNKYFASAARGYKLIQGQLADLECRYVFTTALACGVTNKDTKLTKENYNACFAEKLKPLILKYKPRAIVCLGKQAMDAVLQDKAPKTMKEIQKTGVSVDYYEEEVKLLNCLVLAVDHPARLFIEQTDKAKLASLYELIFSKAERYCLETEVRKPIDFTLISKKPDLYRIAGGKFKEFAFDVENKHNKKDLLKNTIWKRNSELLSLSITYFNETSGFYNNFVIVGEALEDKFLLEKLFSGRSVVTHNGKHDCQVLWNRLGFDVFSHVSEVHDTLAMFYLSNQNRLNNGLKDLSAKYLGIYDYADTVQRYVIEANSRLKILKKQASEELKLKQKQYNWYVEALKVQSGELTVSAQKAKKLKIILNSYPNLEAITELLLLAKQKYKEVPEPGTADYGDIPIDILAQYNAEDTYCTLKLKREIIPFLEKTEGYTYDPVAYKLFQRSLKTVCYVERNGMPLDMTSLLEMKAELEAKEKEIQTKLLSLDVVKEVLLKVDSNQEKLERGKLTEADLPKLISPTKAKFITSLCKNFKLDNFATLTKKNKKSFVSKKCINSIRDSFKDVNQEIFEIFSDLSYIGNNRQVRSKFIKNWSTYYVPEDGKLHCSYNLTKNQSLAYNTGSSDSGAQSGRLSCIAEGSLVEVVRDLSKFPKGIPIEKVNIGDLAYTYDSANNLTLKPVTNVIYNGIRETVIIEWIGTGKKHKGSLTLTPDHPVGLVDGSYKPAGELESGDRILSVSRSNKLGYSFINYFYDSSVRDHRFILESLGYDLKDKHVHHEDNNKLNNLVTNLRIMSPSEHHSLHYNLLPKEEKMARTKNVLKPEYRAKIRHLKGPEHPKWLPVKKISILRALLNAGGKPLSAAKILNISYETFVNRCYSYNIDYMSIRKRFNNSGVFISRGLVKKATSKEVTNLDKFSRSLGIGYRKLKSLIDYYGLNNNHIVLNVKKGPKVKVYDLEIKDTHNFIVNELKVHNCTAPNLQQIRKVGYLRKHFRAPPGYVFCEIDYSSLEPCLISSVSNCERLKEVFKKKLDIYRVTANDIYEFGVDLNAPPEKVKEALKTRVNETDRDKLKIGFLAWCYGRGIPSFARDMKITEEEAVEFYRKAKEMYYEIYDWKEGIIDAVKNQEMVHTLFGRKREFPVMPPLNRSDEERKRYRKELSKAIRVAVNFPIQSLGSDICLWQASNIQDWIIDENLEQVIVIVNLVHDAIWFLIKESQIDWAVPELQKRMEDITTLPNGIDVPLNTEALWGPTLASYLKKNTQLELSYP